MLDSQSFPKNTLDPEKFENSFPTEISDNINIGHLVTVATKLNEKLDDSNDNPAFVILFAGKQRPRNVLYETVKLVIMGVEHDIPEAGRALLMLKNWLNNPDDDLKKIMGEGVTDFDAMLNQFSEQVNGAWKYKGNDLSEAWKDQNQPGTATEKTTPVKNDLLQTPENLVEMVKTPPEGDMMDNIHLMKQGKIKEVEEKYKERVAKMKQTLQELHKAMPKLIEDLDAIEPSLISSRSREWLLTDLDFITNKNSPYNEEYVQFQNYLLRDFSQQYNDERDPNNTDPNNLSEESSFIGNMSLNSLDKFYKSHLDHILVRLFEVPRGKRLYRDLDKDIFQEWTKTLFNFLKKFDIYILDPKPGEKFNSNLYEPFSESEDDDNLPSGTLKEVHEAGYYQRFEDKAKVFKKPLVITVK